MNFSKINFTVFCLTVSNVVLSSFQIDVPLSFYGSSEVFFGYLSNSEEFIQAFTLSDDHITISGSIQEVEHILSNMRTKGNNTFAILNIIFPGMFWGFIIFQLCITLNYCSQTSCLFKLFTQQLICQQSPVLQVSIIYGFFVKTKRNFTLLPVMTSQNSKHVICICIAATSVTIWLLSWRAFRGLKRWI